MDAELFGEAPEPIRQPARAAAAVSVAPAPLSIYNDDCIDAQRRIPNCSVDLGIHDPPFGIGETKFDRCYNRDSSKIIAGYREAPPDYAAWTLRWLAEAKRVLKPNGSMFVIMGHTHLRHLLNAAAELGLHELNHVIWKFQFGVNATNKFVTSHYHVLFYAKSKSAVPIFNTYCRYTPADRDGKRSLLYADLEDVFCIQRDYAPGERKNQNKLPAALVEKLISYSSNPGDMVCDFFMGNFTTAYCALKLGRRVCGYEINPAAYQHHMKLLIERQLAIKMLRTTCTQNFDLGRGQKRDTILSLDAKE
jgi:site-specific DNA-methyltransferase (adenine-specific)